MKKHEPGSVHIPKEMEIMKQEQPQQRKRIADFLISLCERWMLGALLYLLAFKPDKSEWEQEFLPVGRN